MANTIGMPKFGLTMETGQIVKWIKQEGEWVERGDALVEISTDKIVNEYESPHSGFLLKVLLPEGQEAKVLAPICVLGEKGEAVPDAAAPAAKKQTAQPAAAGPAAPGAPAKKARVSPLARKLAKKQGVDLAAVTGSGPHGRIVKEDVERFLAAGKKAATAAAPAAASAAAPAAQQADTTVPMSEMRRIIADRLAKSKREIPHFYLKQQVDMGKALSLKADFALAQETTGVKITVTHLLVAAVARALREFPDVNVSFKDNSVLKHAHINIGLAVEIQGGLIVPVIAGADGKSLRELAAAANDLAARARENRLQLSEITGGTFTITNMGMYGIDEFAAIINPPEAAILAVGTIAENPVIRDGTVTATKTMNVTLSVDHRVIDGGLGARFLGRIKELLEHPGTLLV